VETFANIAPIIRNGGEWYAGIGTEKSKGTKVFALAGASKTPGWSKFPWEFRCARSFEIGGGIPEGASSRRCRPAARRAAALPGMFLDMPVDYESLAKRRLDHGIGRHDRDGRNVVHGRCRRNISWTSA
jgi:bidirectional [NiFe] hydrogenase diaphorase subunit